MKSLFNSKTFWLAVLQLVAGYALVTADVFPEVAGHALALKSLVDIILRVVTTTGVKIV